MTKHLRRSYDKAFTKKLWQSHEGEKRGEKTGDISPLHLNYILGQSFHERKDSSFAKDSKNEKIIDFGWEKTAKPFFHGNKEIKKK